MLKIHTEGVGICGIYPNDIAMTKVQQVNKFSRQNQHPLMCIMEKN
jgi:ATP-dependent Clp protease adaptor protein ClpS